LLIADLLTLTFEYRFSIDNRKSKIDNQLTLSVASETKNSGVTIIGT
jgi:hypothetical protein